MDFALSTEQQMLSDSVARFIKNEYRFEHRLALVAVGMEESTSFWGTFADNGWLAAAVPETRGGFGGTAAEIAIISEQLGRGLVLEPWIGSAVLAIQTLLATGDETLLTEWLPSLCDGSRRLALAYSEAGAAGMPSIVETSAALHGGGYQLTGRKTLVLGGMGADAYLVSARLNGGIDDREGIGLFLVPAEAAGLTATSIRLHDDTVAAEVTLDGVPATAVLVNRGEGIAALEYGLQHAMMAQCAELVGAMEQSVKITAEYLRTRKQFGVTIGSFQSLQHRIADMAAEMEMARSMLFAALESFENDDAGTRASTVAAAKAFITMAARNVCGQGIQLHGGIGMTEECAIGHYFKRAIVADALFGNHTLHQAACAEALRKQLQAQFA